MKMNYISHSRLSSYSSFYGCPRKFEFSYVQNLTRITMSGSLGLGGATHHAIGSMIPEGEERGTVWAEAFTDYFESVFERIDPEADRPALKAKGLEMVAALDEELPADLGEAQYKIETPPTVINGVEIPPFVGYADYYNPTDHHLIELKTSGRINSNPYSHLPQLGLYSIALETLTTEAPTLDLVQVTSAKTVRVLSEPVTIDAEQKEWLKRYVSNTVAAIEADHFPERITPNCRFCDFREACQFADFSKLREKGPPRS